MGDTSQLQRLPDGFLERGASVTRLEAYRCDVVFRLHAGALVSAGAPSGVLG